jgi:hypothetical protein
MDNNEMIYSQIEATETNSIELKKVKFQRKWNFWENYETKHGEKQLDWSETIKKIFTFEDVITFWQFWNDYPGSNPTNIFYDGIRVR